MSEGHRDHARDASAGQRTVWILAALVAAGISSSCTPAGSVDASTALRLDVEGLVQRADLVLEAEVLSADATVDAAGRIGTDFLLSVDRTWWGPDQTTRMLRMPGGVLADGSGLVISGMPSLLPGERSVLFLSEPSKDGIRMPVGLSQGRFRVLSTLGGAPIAVQDQTALSLVETGSGELIPNASVSVVDYAELSSRIEAAIVAKRARLFREGRRNDR